jgi:hypothetical protein
MSCSYQVLLKSVIWYKVKSGGMQTAWKECRLIKAERDRFLTRQEMHVQFKRQMGSHLCILDSCNLAVKYVIIFLYRQEFTDFVYVEFISYT